MTIPREEITVGRAVLLEVIKTVSERRYLGPVPLLNDAITSIANVGAQQGYRTAWWLAPAADVWMIAWAADALTIYPPGEQRDVAVIMQNALRKALAEQAPTTCRAMQKQLELGDVTCGHCCGAWNLTHTCEGQPEPIAPKRH